MNSEVITVATHKEGLFDKLINNKFNVKITVLGMGEKWTGFDMKFKLIYNYIKNLPDDKIIIFVDGFDSLVNGKLEDAIKTFKENNFKCLFSHDVNKKLSKIENKFLKKIFGTCKNGNIANSGLYMGYVKYLKIILNEALKNKCKDDQVVLNKNVCKKYDFIDIDINNLIFENVLDINNIQNVKAIFISQPGIPSLNRWYRGIFEYGQFLIDYILIVYISIFIICIIYKLYKSIFIITLILLLYFNEMDKSCLL